SAGGRAGAPENGRGRSAAPELHGIRAARGRGHRRHRLSSAQPGSGTARAEDRHLEAALPVSESARMSPPPPPSGGGSATEAGREPSFATPDPQPETRSDLQTGMKGLAAIARHHGLDWSLQRLLHVYGSQSEPEAGKLAQIAREEGMKSAVH